MHTALEHPVPDNGRTRKGWTARTLQTIGAIFLAALFVLQDPGPALSEVTRVPPGNRNAEQPKIPTGAISRTRALRTNFEEKYRKIRDLIAGNADLRRKIIAAGERYDIEPIHIVGALVGEHTYNVDALDHLQTYLVKAASYFGSDLEFRYDGEPVTKFIQRPQFAACQGLVDSYDLWGCRENVWDNTFRGKTVAGKAWPDNSFGRVFFQPLYAGQTFGLGQLNPLTALRVNDLVVRVSGLGKLSADRAPEVYKTIMDPDLSLQYVAAVIRIAIDSYREIAQMDISGNPGITATLYNLGDIRARANILSAKNAARSKLVLPEENYYGWLINDKLEDLKPLVGG